MHLFSNINIDFAIVEGILCCVLGAVIARIWRSVSRAIIRQNLRLTSEYAQNTQDLDTQWLMKAPRSHVPQGSSRAYTYAIRKRYVIVYDASGEAWVGPLLPTTIYHLANHYREMKHRVPIRGEGEKYAGDPIIVDGFSITTYPEWIGRKSPVDDLRFWAFLEKTWGQTYNDTGRSIENDFRYLKLLPFER